MRDAIEPPRPSIDAKVFAFVAEHEFARSDFPQSGYNVHRLSRDVTQLLSLAVARYRRCGALDGQDHSGFGKEGRLRKAVAALERHR